MAAVSKPRRRMVVPVAEEAKAAGQEYRLVDADFIVAEGNIRGKDSAGFAEQELGELAESIKAVGMLQPILVRKLGSVDRQAWGVVLGERRLRAARLAGLKEVPCRVIDVPAKEVSGLQLTENVLRVGLSPLEEAQAISDIMFEQELTQEQVGKRLGKGQSWVAERLSLLDLPDPVKKSIARGIVSASAGEVMARYSKAAPDVVANVAEKMKEKPLPVSKMRQELDYRVAQKCKPLDSENSWDKPIFDPAPCLESCPKVLWLKPYDKERPYCSDPTCWAEKNKAAEEELKKAAMESAGAGVADLDALGSGKWQELHDAALQRCTPDCQYHVTGVSKIYIGSPKTMKACLNPQCFRELEKKAYAEKQEAEDRQRDEVVTRYVQKCDSLRYASHLASLPPRLLVSLAAPLLIEHMDWYDQQAVKRFTKQIGWHDKIDQYTVRDSEPSKFRAALETLPGYELATLLLDRMIARGVRNSRDLDKVQYLVGEEAPAPGQMEIPDDIDAQTPPEAEAPAEAQGEESAPEPSAMTPAGDDLLVTVLSAIRAGPGIPTEDCDRSTTLLDELAMNDEDLEILVMELERKLGSKYDLGLGIWPVDSSKWVTVGDVVEYLEKRKGEAGGA